MLVMTLRKKATGEVFKDWKIEGHRKGETVEQYLARAVWGKEYDLLEIDGKPVGAPKTLTQGAYAGLIEKGLYALEAGFARKTKADTDGRSPLPGWGQRTPFDPFAKDGFVVTRGDNDPDRYVESGWAGRFR